MASGDASQTSKLDGEALWVTVAKPDAHAGTARAPLGSPHEDGECGDEHDADRLAAVALLAHRRSAHGHISLGCLASRCRFLGTEIGSEASFQCAVVGSSWHDDKNMFVTAPVFERHWSRTSAD